MRLLEDKNELNAEKTPDTAIIIVSRHALFRHSIQMMLKSEFSQVLSCENIHSLRLTSELKKRRAIVLLEPLSGVDLADLLKPYRAFLENWQVVLILGEIDEVEFGSAIQAGVSGCITQHTPPDFIANLLAVVASGHIVWPKSRKLSSPFNRRATDRKEQHHRRRPNDLDQKLTALSKREIEVLTLAGQGLGNKRIATAMDIADTTVRLHVRSIMRKLEVENRSQLVIHAIHASGD